MMSRFRAMRVFQPPISRETFPKDTRRNDIVIITLNNIAASFWRNSDVIITFAVIRNFRLSGLMPKPSKTSTLHYVDNERDGVSNHQPHDCLLNRLSRHRSKKTSKLCITGLCDGNSPVTGEFPTIRASNAENVTIWWRHHWQKLVEYIIILFA